MELIINSKKHGMRIVNFDDDDAPIILGKTWTLLKCKSTDYVFTTTWDGKRSKKIFMHRLLLSAKKDQQVDHRDGNGLNNQRCNLRLATPSQNARNSNIKIVNTTGYKGVFIHSNGYRVQICVNKKIINGGRIFKDIKAAAKRYNELAIQYHGDFARLNIIPDEYN